jgi:hypothetical protein
MSGYIKMSSTGVLPRGQREKYINNLRLTENQKNKFKGTNLNVNTIQKVVNALSRRRERNVRINGILNALLSGNRRPLNSLLSEASTRQRANTTPNNTRQRANTTPNNTRQRVNTTPNNTRQRANTTPNNTRNQNNQNTQSTRNQNTPRPINDTNRNALKRERPNKANNINKIYKYPFLYNVVPKTKAQRNDNIGRARVKFVSRVSGRSENAFNPQLISDETLNSFINLVNDYIKYKTQLPKNFNRSKYEQILKHYKMICTRVKRYTYSGLNETQLSFLRGLQLICAGGSQANTSNENVAFKNLQENKDKVYDILSLCSKDTFIRLLGQLVGTNDDTWVRIYIEDLSKRLNERIKDLDAVKAITFYLKHQARNNNNRLRSFDSYIASLGKTKNTIKLIPEDLRKLIGSFKVVYATKRVHGLPLALESGPADHDSLSNRSLQNMVNNPSTFNAFSPKSLFLYFVWNAMEKHGAKKNAGRCGFRGKIDDALLRRRVVFANVGGFKELGYRTFAEALVAMNHGRTHTLKTIVKNGNRSIGVPGKMKNNRNSKSYVNAMKNRVVRNNVMFLNTEEREKNHLYKLQVGQRVALKFDGEKLTKFDPNPNGGDIENPNVLWTTYGLHMEQTTGGKSYKFFDLLRYLYGDKTNLNPRENGKGIGNNYVIQLDSKTLDWLHKQYYFTDKLGEDYRTQIIKKITSCRRQVN